MPRKSRGWKVWTETSGDSFRCRWNGAHGTGQQTFVRKIDARDLRDSKKAAFQRLDSGLPAIAREEPAPDYQSFRTEHLAWLGRQRAQATAYNAKRAIDFWEAFAGPDFPAASRRQAGRTAEEFCVWMLAREKKNGEPYHVNHVRIILRHLKAAFRWGLKHGHLGYDPFLHFEMPPAVKVARLLTVGELARIMEELPQSCRRALLFVLYTGFRIGEVLRLDWSGVRKSPSGVWYLTVIKSKTRRKDGAETKTQAIHPRALAVMGEPQAAGLVFPISRATLQNRLREAVRKLGLGRVRWHDLRHTWATHLMEDVRDLRAVMDLGGWANVQSAMIYQHATEKRRDASLQMSLEVPIQTLNGAAPEIIDAEKNRENK